MKFKNENERGRIRRNDIIRKGSDRKDVKEREGEEKDKQTDGVFSLTSQLSTNLVAIE